MSYLSILLLRKYWVLASILLVVLGGHWYNSTRPSIYESHSRLSIKSNPIGTAMGNWASSEMEYRSSSHYENLNVPDQSFLDEVRKRMGGKLTNQEIENSYSIRQGDASLILIASRHPNPVVARSLADNLAKAYEEYDLTFRQRSYSEKENWINEQLKARKVLLDSLENGFKNFKKEYPKFSGVRDVSEVVGLENELKQLTLEQEEEEHRLSLVSFALKGQDSVVVAEITRDEPLQKELLNMELELAKLRVEHGAKSRKVRIIEKQMENVRNLMEQNIQENSYTTTVQVNPRYQKLQEQQDEIRSKISVMSARKRELEKMVEEAYVRTTLEPELQLTFNRLQRERDASQKISTMLSEKLEETRLKKSGVSREVYQIGGASQPVENREGTFGLGLLMALGAFLGVLLCFLLEKLNNTIRFPVQIEKNFGISLLGIIPEMELDSGKLDLTSDSKILEPYRSLRTNLNYSSLISEKGGKSVIITSALQGEGKSTKAVNLAICFALEGKKVLLVDSDLRRPSVHRLLNLERGPGLSEYLTGQAGFEEVTKQTQYHGLSITPAGDKMPNPAEILGSPKVKNFLAQAYQEFDVVFFDSPAIFPVSDALALAPLMDGALVVFRSNYTPMRAGEEVLRKLTQVGASIIGGVLNDVRSGKGGYYYSYYGYYGYSYYQTYYEENHPNTKHPWLHAFIKTWKSKISKFFQRFGAAGYGFRFYSILKWVTISLVILLILLGGVIYYYQQKAPPEFIPLSSKKAKMVSFSQNPLYLRVFT